MNTIRMALPSLKGRGAATSGEESLGQLLYHYQEKIEEKVAFECTRRYAQYTKKAN